MAKDLRRAEDLWRTFHDKEHPRELIELEDGFPKSWCLVGRCLQTLYSSDKWRSDGDAIGYYHDHSPEEDGGVWLLAPAGDVHGAPAQDPGIDAWPDAGVVLGTADGFLIVQEEGARQQEAYIGKRALLCAFPDGSALFVWDPRDGVVALVVGDPLTVGAEGIEG